MSGVTWLVLLQNLLHRTIVGVWFRSCVASLCCAPWGFSFRSFFFYLFVVPVWKVFMVMAYGVNVVVSLAIIERVYRRGAPFFWK